MDLAETESDYVHRADLPGLSEDDVNIEFEDGVLTVSGERKFEHEERKDSYFRIERASGSFRRSLTLPDGVDPEAVKGDRRQRVLTAPQAPGGSAQNSGVPQRVVPRLGPHA
jgi:HSP20 family protein